MRSIGNLSTHRGPDDIGVWGDEHYRVRFNRLSIVELSGAGRQPMSSPSANWIIVFNGEVFNHRELRRRLPEIEYRGNSDTETICHAIEVWGAERAISELNGMFAIAAYNTREKKLFLARDFAGIKPLFYSDSPNQVWFASQFDQVVQGVGKSNLSISPEGMRDFLQLGYMPAPHTVYNEILQVRPGEIVEFDSRLNCKCTRYFELSRLGFTGAGTFSNGRHDFRSLMSDTIRDQLVADVPLGSFISSGIDSPLVSGYASKLNKNLKTFTFGIDGDHEDERKVAGEYARLMGVHHLTETVSSSEVIAAVDQSFRFAAEPFGDHSSVPTYLITKSAKKHNTVMLSGDGGDELFWGYPRWNTYLQNYHRFKLPRSIRRGQRYLSRNRNGKYAYGPGIFETPGEWVLNGQSHNKADVMDRIMPGSRNTATVRELFEFQFGPSQSEFRNWLRWNEFYGHLQRVLVKVDRMSMANSLEVRVPFLDKRIIEYAWNLDSDYGIKHFENKKLLKKELEKFVPPEAINQKKVGFSVPLNAWLRGSLEVSVKDLLLGNDFYGNEHLNRKALKDYVSDYFSDKNLNSWGIWILYSWQKWGEYIWSL